MPALCPSPGREVKKVPFRIIADKEWGFDCLPVNLNLFARPYTAKQAVVYLAL